MLIKFHLCITKLYGASFTLLGQYVWFCNIFLYIVFIRLQCYFLHQFQFDLAASNTKRLNGSGLHDDRNLFFMLQISRGSQSRTQWTVWEIQVPIIMLFHHLKGKGGKGKLFSLNEEKAFNKIYHLFMIFFKKTAT